MMTTSVVCVEKGANRRIIKIIFITYRSINIPVGVDYIYIGAIGAISSHWGDLSFLFSSIISKENGQV